MADKAFQHGRRLTLLVLALTIAGLLGSAYRGVRELDDWRKHQLSAWRVSTWFTMQAQAHLLRLMADLDSFGMGASGIDRETVLLQFELVWSRIDVLEADEVASFFVGSAAVDCFVDDSRRHLGALEPLIARLEPCDASTLRSVKESVGALARRLANLSLALNRERVAALQEMDADSAALLTRFLVTIAGVVVAGAVLVGLLVQATRLQVRHLRQSRSAELRAGEAERDLRTVIDALPAIVSATDRQGRYLFTNRFHACFFAAAPRGMVPARHELGVASGSLPGHAAVDVPHPPAFREELTIDGRGEERVLLATEVPIAAGNGSTDRTVRIALDITERKRAEDRVRFLAERDALTGLANRATLMMELEARLANDLTRQPLALLLVDLDDFKGVNWTAPCFDRTGGVAREA